MKYYNMDVDDVFKALNTADSGLSFSEVKFRLNKYGKNKLNVQNKKSKIIIFFDQFCDLMIAILILAAILSFVLSVINNESFIDSIIILVIVFLNAILGYIQQLKADNAMEALSKMQVSMVKVKRENKLCVIDSEDVVKGDILVLEAGDKVVADARIIWAVSLKVDESSLTGESVPVSKDSSKIDCDMPLSERKNMIFSGTNIVYGRCIAVVCKTGNDTEFGLIAKGLDNEENELTPLQNKINGISKFLSFIIMIVILLVFIIGVIKGMDIMEVIMLSISLAVAAIPEGLPAVITVILALSMNSLAKKRAIVRKMSSVETLGCTEIICSDKTGTITQNKMKVKELYYDDKLYTVEEIDKDNLLLNIMALNNDVEKNNNEYIGDPTEIALYECCENFFDIVDFRNNNKRIDELPFDSDRKMMSVVNINNDNVMLYTKGSFDSVITHCSYLYSNGSIVVLTEEEKKILKNVEISESNKAYRILAYAYKSLDNYDSNSNLEEENLIFVGMSAMIDPPRDDVKEAIDACRKAHIKPIMITGDSLSTAVSIAKEVGILKSSDEAIVGVDLDKMSNEELKKAVNNYSVYARVSPSNKLAIVNALKENNKIVAMTGDGVNDAPALKSANIGVGMGIMGTEVSKNVSDIVLADDSFSTIVTAVREGRRIFDNIRNVLVYLLTSNIAEILVVFIGMLFGVEIFLPIQLLYINLVTDSIPAIALAFEKEEDNIMCRDVRRNDGTFFTSFLIAKMGLSSVLKTIAILLVYFLNLKIYNLEVATTMAFLTLILLEMVYAYSCRNLKKTIINKDIFSNSYMNKSLILLGVVQLIIFITPLRNIFNIVSLNMLQLLYCFLVVILIFLIDELSKGMICKMFKD